MTREEKYKQALEKARKELQELKNKDCDDTTRRTAINVIYNLFPELKEDEDERIKFLIKGCAYAADITPEGREDIFAWVEKQGKKLDADEVIAWLEKHYLTAPNGWPKDCIKQFKKDFGL